MAWPQDFIEHPVHAVLLTGPSAETTAGAVAAAQSLLQGRPEYLRHVLPDAKGAISIAHIRALIEFFQLKVPGRATIRRAAIIEQADAMTREAQNALLKILEEPPADSVLILTAINPQDLLPTIRSRVQVRHLQGETLIPDTEAVQLVKQALGGTSYDRLLLIDGPLKARDVAKVFVDTLATVAEASLQAAAQKGHAPERWQRILQAASTAQDAFEQSGNPKLVLTELMLAL